MSVGKILVPYKENIYVISYSSILFFKSDNYYSNIYLSDGRSYLLVKSLAKLEREVQNDEFIRISQSLLVNTRHITSIDKKKKIISLLDKHLLPFTVSVKKLAALIMNVEVVN